MSSGEKKIAVVLVVVLAALVAAYFVMGPKTAPMGPGGQAGAAGSLGQTETMGPEDAKVKIVGLVPTVNPCHAATVAALKKVYEQHPEDIHLTLIDFLGPASGEWRQKLGVSCATVEINGEYSFELDGRRVVFQQAEGGTYRPSDLKTVVEAELAKAG